MSAPFQMSPPSARCYYCGELFYLTGPMQVTAQNVDNHRPPAFLSVCGDRDACAARLQAARAARDRRAMSGIYLIRHLTPCDHPRFDQLLLEYRLQERVRR